jgi:hypothetical protein
LTHHIVLVNRAPVLTLWASVVAERLGFDHEAALSLGKTLAGLNSQAKGQRLGIYKPAERMEGEPSKRAHIQEEFSVELLGRRIPTKHTEKGIRAVDKDKPINPQSVGKYLKEKFGPALEDVQRAMRVLAQAFEPKELNDKAFALYERFRPTIPEGVRGWGAKGELNLKLICDLAEKTHK